MDGGLTRSLSVLVALLHDSGKIFQRLGSRGQGELERLLEPSSALWRGADRQFVGDARRLWGMIRGCAGRGGHEEWSRCFIAALLRELRLGERLDIESLVKSLLGETGRYVRLADRVSAAERGFAGIYSRIAPVYLERLDAAARSRDARYTVEGAPFLSPLWLAVAAGYRRGVGQPRYQNLVDSFRGSSVAEALSLVHRACGGGVGDECRRAAERLADEVARIVFGDAPLWFPVLPLTTDYIAELRAYDYTGAYRRSSYPRVAARLLADAAALTLLYGRLGADRMMRGFIESLGRAYEKAAFFVPAAVYGAVAPDTSLAAHSRSVAAIAAALGATGKDTFCILGLDFVGIQGFVARLRRAEKAGKLLRGRSLLLELLQRSLTFYITRLYEVHTLNTIVDEGGAPRYIIPDFDDKGARLQLLRRVLSRVSHCELNDEMHIVAGAVCGISERHASYLEALVEERGDSFPTMLGSLAERIAEEKARIYKDQVDILGERDERPRYDSLTGSFSWSRGCAVNELGFEVDEERLEYLDGIAPEAYAPGDTITGHVHRLLALGYVARNAIYMLEVYIYRLNDEGLPEPDARAALEAARLIVEKLGGRPYQLIVKYTARLEREEARVNIGVIPLPELGAVHVIVSVDTPLSRAGGERIPVARMEAYTRSTLPLVLDAAVHAISMLRSRADAA